jgi:hypothetical protein
VFCRPVGGVLLKGAKGRIKLYKIAKYVLKKIIHNHSNRSKVAMALQKRGWGDGGDRS